MGVVETSAAEEAILEGEVAEVGKVDVVRKVVGTGAKRLDVQSGGIFEALSTSLFELTNGVAFKLTSELATRNASKALKDESLRDRMSCCQSMLPSLQKRKLRRRRRSPSERSP